jgi:hypothetical protein
VPAERPHQKAAYKRWRPRAVRHGVRSGFFEKTHLRETEIGLVTRANVELTDLAMAAAEGLRAATDRKGRLLPGEDTPRLALIGGATCASHGDCFRHTIGVASDAGKKYSAAEE